MSATDPRHPHDQRDPHLAALHADLVARADAAGDLDVAYRTLDTPIGGLVLAATPVGLVRVGFADAEGEEAVLADLAARVSPRVLAAPRRLDRAARALEDYLTGRRREVDVPLDLVLVRGFRREVVTALPRVGYGATASYAEVAALVERPRAVRAVGTACATNPLPLALPCHRVVRSDGGEGRYRGGSQVKHALLAMERRLA